MYDFHELLGVFWRTSVTEGVALSLPSLSTETDFSSVGVPCGWISRMEPGMLMSGPAWRRVGAEAMARVYSLLTTLYDQMRQVEGGGLFHDRSSSPNDVISLVVHSPRHEPPTWMAKTCRTGFCRHRREVSRQADSSWSYSIHSWRSLPLRLAETRWTGCLTAKSNVRSRSTSDKGGW